MAVTFTRAIEVVAGTPITSAQYNARAMGFNDRLRSGIANGTWRIHYNAHGLVNQIIYPDGTLWAPAAEFQQFYMHVDPWITNLNWPVGGANEPQGANTANPLMAYVYGDASAPPEHTRLEIVPLWMEDGLGNQWHPGTPREMWEMAAAQRGGYDPNTGEEACPVFIAAQEYRRITSSMFYGKSYGGYAPTPLYLGDCDDGTESTPPTRMYQLVFNPLKAGLPVKTYTQGCPDNPGHVAYVARMPFAYYVVFMNGTYERLSVKDYLEGPYQSGGVLAKQDGHQLSRAMQWYLNDFGGSDAQRAGSDYYSWKASEGGGPEKYGFDFEKFFNSQYFLAPARAVSLGDGQLGAQYPVFRTEVSVVVGASISNVLGGTTHTFADGFVLSGLLVKAEKVYARPVIEVMSGSAVLREIEIYHGYEEIILFPDAVRPEPLSFRIKGTDVNFDPGGFIQIEVAEVLGYKPEMHDAFCAVRLMSTTGDLLGRVDGAGTHVSYPAKEMSDRYFTWGFISNPHSGQITPQGQFGANDNPVVDAARRFIRKHLRVIRRQELVGYEVQNGKSILYFKRYAFGMVNNQVDQFIGIADEIRHEAPAGGTTNQWLLSVNTKPYHTSESSLWKPDAFADVISPLFQRCHFYGQELASDQSKANVRAHVAYRQKPILIPEAPSAYNYTEALNGYSRYTPDPGPNFYKGCRIYEPDLEIESAVVESGNIVKVTLKGRLRHYEHAPATIGFDIGTWELNALHNEPFRTDENAIREYLVSESTGTRCAWMPGDDARDSPLRTFPDNPFGSCYPTFLLTHLMPLKPEDGNSDQDAGSDAPLDVQDEMQAEFYLKSMCEGYVDGTTSAAYGCAAGISAMFDYTFENLCYEAFGGRSLGLMSNVKRPDEPIGYGPLVRTEPSAEMFNRSVRALNLLTRARLPLPVKLEIKTDAYETVASIAKGSLSWDPNDSYCTNQGSKIGKFGHTPHSPALLHPGEWEESALTGIGAGVSAGFDTRGNDFCVTPGDDNSGFAFTVNKTVVNYRFVIQDAETIEAVPEHIRDMVSGGLGFVGFYSETMNGSQAETVATFEEADSCCPSFQNPCPGLFFPYRFRDPYAPEEGETVAAGQCQLFPGSGALDPGPAPSGDFAMVVGLSETRCNKSTSRGVSIDFVNTRDNIFIEVPLAT